MGRIVRKFNTFTTQPTKQLKTPTKWTFDFLVNLLFKVLEFLQDANVINKDVIAAQIDQVTQVLELMDLGPWINFWKRLEDKLKLNKHLEPLVTILPFWIQCSMDAIKELNNNRLLPNLLRNLKKMVRNRK